MTKNFNKFYIFPLLILFFLLFSFSPTLFELSKSNQLQDPSREFILEHNYYWPDFNLYLSKIRQGYEGNLLAKERYTSEPHHGSLIQQFYVVLGWFGRPFDIDPNLAYQFGRLLLSPLLLYLIMILSIGYFRSFRWQLLAFLIVVVSGSFPRFYTDAQGVLHIGRYMEWWSNIDALQRITFIPHILFGQIVSFYLLYRLTIKQFNNLTMKQLFIYILLGNTVGLVFPPSLITLDGVIIISVLLSIIHNQRCTVSRHTELVSVSYLISNVIPKRVRDDKLYKISWPFAFCLFTLPSLLYLFITTQSIPWSALVQYHRTHPMMIPFVEYIKGTGPVFFLGLAGAIWSIFNRDRKFQPLILWLIVTFFFAILFTHVKEQSPLRFTQTGLFIPLGILAAYLLNQLFHLSDLSYLGYLSKGVSRTVVVILLLLYLLSGLFMMKVSLDWQIDWISQRLRSNIPLVPDPPQAMYPLKSWMDAIRWLGKNTLRDDVVLSDITAGNYIPAYSGNTVYFGQANTVDYERKQNQVWDFYDGKMGRAESLQFLKRGRIKYIFVSYQEKARMKGKELEIIYPFVKPVYKNDAVTVFGY